MPGFPFVGPSAGILTRFTFVPAPVNVARMWRGILVLICPAMLLGGCATSRSTSTIVTPEPYVRVREPSPGVVQLEIAARRFTPHRGHGPALWLTGASHLGDAAYYRALQQHLDARTLVLFEGVGGADAKRGPALRQERDSAVTAPHDAPANQSSLQSQLAKSLGLEFQLEAIDYGRAHFRNSDLTVVELRDLMAHAPPPVAGVPAAAAAAGAATSARAEASRSFEQLMSVMQGESFLGRLMNLGLRWLGTQPRYQALAKFTLVEMINGVQGDFESVGALPPAMRELLRVLIEERNQRVLSDLRRELPRLGPADSVSIFFGAGHMRDLEVRLRRELRYEVRDEVWFPVMTVNASAAGITPAELAATRELIQRQLQTLRTGPPGAW
jgi:hypothetical protein